MPVAELAARRWDVVVVGGGHNGLTAAAYLARAGRSVLVLEAREQLGGAATLQRPFADSRLPDQPVRLRRRACCTRWSSTELGCAGTGSTWCCSTRACGARSPTAARSRCGPTRSARAARGRRDRAVRRRRVTCAYEALFERIRRALRTGPARHLGRRQPGPGRAGRAAGRRPGGARGAAGPLDRRRRRGARRRRAAAGAAARPGRDRHLGRPARPGHGGRARDARDGHAGRRALGVRARRHRAGVVRARRRGGRARRRAGRRGARSARSSRGSACGWPAASWSGRRSWCPTPTRSAPRRCAPPTCRQPWRARVADWRSTQPRPEDQLCAAPAAAVHRRRPTPTCRTARW